MPPPPLTIAEATRAAVAHHQAGQPQTAETLCKAVLARDPNNAAATHLLGLIAHQGGRRAQGLRLLRRSLALAPDVPDFHGNLGSVLGQMGRYDEAVAAFRQA